jgi:hypothetical protein
MATAVAPARPAAPASAAGAAVAIAGLAALDDRFIPGRGAGTLAVEGTHK